MNLSVISACSSYCVKLGRWTPGKLNVSECVNMLLFDGVNSHSNISHPVVVAGSDSVGSLVGETVVSVEEHEGIREIKLCGPWIAYFIQLQLIKEGINCGFTVFSTE